MKFEAKRFIGCALALLLAAAGVQAHAQGGGSKPLRIAVSTSAEHPLTVGARRFAELVQQKSGGRMKAQVFDGATLGSDLQVIGSLRGGVVDATIVTAGLLTSQAKEYNLFILPGVLHDAREADAVLDGPFGRKVLESLQAHGLVGLAHMEHGFKHVTNSRRGIHRWEDIEGLKLRVTQTPSLIDVFKRLGANPTPMAFGEVYNALEQRAIDGMETTLATFETTKLYEVQKHIALTGHIYDPLVLLFSKPSWDRLSADERKVLNESAIEAARHERTFTREKEARLLAELKERGTVITAISPQEKARMREQLRPVVDKYAQAVGEAASREFFAEIAKVRAGGQ